VTLLFSHLLNQSPYCFQSRRFKPDAKNASGLSNTYLPTFLIYLRFCHILIHRMKKMDAQKKYEYWLDNAQYDLDTADALLSNGRWLYVVFMCQQAIEKLVKGLYVLYVDDHIPHVHAIRQIIRKFEADLPESVSPERYELFDKLSAFYLEGRYTDYKKKMFELLDKQEAETFMRQTKEAFAWLLTLKP
jgi:HEPN domain-containing protein